MLPEAMDSRIDYSPQLPQPPQPKRRGPLEFYEWIILLLFLFSLGLSIATHFELDPERFGVKEGVNIVEYPDLLTMFFFLMLIFFDVSAGTRYRMYSDELLTQWKEDKLRFMKMYSNEMERRAIEITESASAKKK